MDFATMSAAVDMTADLDEVRGKKNGTLVEYG
jgi:hypothetical protein